MHLKDGVDGCLGLQPCLDYSERDIKTQKGEKTKHLTASFKTSSGKLVFTT